MKLPLFIFLFALASTSNASNKRLLPPIEMKANSYRILPAPIHPAKQLMVLCDPYNFRFSGFYLESDGKITQFMVDMDPNGDHVIQPVLCSKN